MQPNVCGCRHRFGVFQAVVDIVSSAKNICCGLKKAVAQSRARMNFEQQILVLLLVFHQALNLSRNKFVVMPPSWIPTKQNQPISVLQFFNPQVMFLLRDKLILQGEKRETSTKKLETKQCCATSLGFLDPVFRRLKVRSGYLADEWETASWDGTPEVW